MNRYRDLWDLAITELQIVQRECYRLTAENAALLEAGEALIQCANLRAPHGIAAVEAWRELVGNPLQGTPDV